MLNTSGAVTNLSLTPNPFWAPKGSAAANCACALTRVFHLYGIVGVHDVAGASGGALAGIRVDVCLVVNLHANVLAPTSHVASPLITGTHEGLNRAEIVPSPLLVLHQRTGVCACAGDVIHFRQHQRVAGQSQSDLPCAADALRLHDVAKHHAKRHVDISVGVEFPDNDVVGVGLPVGRARVRIRAGARVAGDDLRGERLFFQDRPDTAGLGGGGAAWLGVRHAVEVVHESRDVVEL